MHVTSAAECPALPNLRFESMGDIRRASKAFREDFRNVEARLILDSYREYRLACIRTSLSLLRRANLPERVLVSARLKRLESTHRKMMRYPADRTMPVHEMDDVIGFRIVCESFDDAVALGQRIASNVPARTKDYIGNVHGAGIGYRAIHGIARFRQPLLDRYVTEAVAVDGQAPNADGSEDFVGTDADLVDAATAQPLVCMSRPCGHVTEQLQGIQAAFVDAGILV